MYEEKTRGTRRTQGFINQTKRLHMHVFSVLCVYTFLEGLHLHLTLLERWPPLNNSSDPHRTSYHKS